ncbi:hypothetical protein GW17_00028843 [Ensete ventricosum]|nr:hypothetical protein GW17_00028843 [Ensete ventricosum]
MHLLWFPNSGIRAKVFVRKISFKLHVMRLNHIELFYVFLLRFRSKHSEEEEGRPATAKASPQGVAAAHRVSTSQGWRLRAEASPAMAAAYREQGGWLQGACKGLPPMASPTASRGGDCRWVRAAAVCAAAAATATQRGQEG